MPPWSAASPAATCLLSTSPCESLEKVTLCSWSPCIYHRVKSFCSPGSAEGWEKREIELVVFPRGFIAFEGRGSVCTYTPQGVRLVVCGCIWAVHQGSDTWACAALCRATPRCILLILAVTPVHCALWSGSYCSLSLWSGLWLYGELCHSTPAASLTGKYLALLLFPRGSYRNCSLFRMRRRGMLTKPYPQWH